MFEYHYMVTYAHPMGTGRINVIKSKKIKSYDDVVDLDAFISNYNNIKNIAVMDFKLLQVKIKLPEWLKRRKKDC